jgi:thymidylate kinase
MEQESITYCHWKSNIALDRSASAQNDLDLLVAREHAGRLAQLLFRLGFKQAQPPVEKQMPGVLDYYGYDARADRLVHVHAHFQLAMGHDMTKNVRLAIERPYLQSASPQGLFMVPEPEFEFIALVVRMILKHATWDAILFREGKLKASERRELVDLQARVDPARLQAILSAHLPFLDAEFFSGLVAALQPGSSIRKRLKAGRQLQKRMQSNSVHSMGVETFLKLSRRFLLVVRRRLLKSPSKYRLQAGGALVAILGGDGAGKTTAVDGLQAWLSRKFDVRRVHMGKPAWSRTTILVRSLLKLGQLMQLYPLEASFEETLQQKSWISPGYPYLIREVCRARDRYLTYLKARRAAARGSLVLLDRFPMSQIQLMDGMQAERFLRELQQGARAKQLLAPRLDSRLAQYLVRLEKSYYDLMMQPELMVVLRVHPDIAAARKTDEDPSSVRRRSAEIWALDWSGTQAHVIDTSQPTDAVMAELKDTIWQRL